MAQRRVMGAAEAREEAYSSIDGASTVEYC
eukprot:COSAG06_NODE_63689_length_261_cov_1.512346_1_plen_29_part_10